MKRKAIWVFILLIGAGWLLPWLIPKHPILEGIRFSQAVYDKNNNLLRLTLSDDEKYRLKLPLSDISPLVVESTLLQEDRYFFYHPGINPVSLLRGAWHTYIARDRRMGGSTLTMQLARVRSHIASRTLLGKFIQIAEAIKLEWFYSKKEILEAYLNLAPYGFNIEGIGAASLIYYNKDADKLTMAEALALSVIPQSPARRLPAQGQGKNYTELTASRKSLFDKWLFLHPHDKESQPSFELQIDVHTPADLPFHAPHFVDAALEANHHENNIMTTLDIRMQNLLARHAKSYVESKRHIGINNVSAMLIDYHTMEVKGVLGSVDFFNNEIQGQVNGTKAKRSPGSAMKPFIYALGIDHGIIHPLTMLKDAPSSFGDYNPENFDNEFTGPVKAKDALIRSRNIPAVQIASKLANPNLYQFLQSAGIAQLREESFYGLSLVLGSSEVTMEELVKLYAMLANGGVLKPLRTRMNDPRSEGIRLIGEESCFLTLEMLKDNPRPSIGYQEDWARDSLPVYWKTGTSHSFRDAWAVGIFGPYVLAVWIGNFNGEGNPAFIGVEAAAPLFFQIVDAIKSQERLMDAIYTWDMHNLEKVEVCALSGQIPGPYCRHITTTWFIPGKSPIKICDIHREVIIDTKTGLRACNSSARRTRVEVYEFWPSDLLKIFKQAGVPRRIPPPDNPDCPLQTRANKGIPPQITSPMHGVIYNLRAHSLEKETIPLQAVTDADSRQVYWFVNKKFLGKSKPADPLFWTPEPGNFVLRVVDDQGRSDVRDIKIVIIE
jgi:penicillin-binding protein 1C